MVVRALNILKLLLNSIVYFTEVAKHNILFEDLTQLLMSKNSLIALLAGQVIKAMVHLKGARRDPSI